MAKLSKRQAAIKAKLVPGKLYSIEEAVAFLAAVPAAKFKESIDVAVNLGIDPRKSDQVVRGATVLPAGTGKTVRVAVFAHLQCDTRRIAQCFQDRRRTLLGDQFFFDDGDGLGGVDQRLGQLGGRDLVGLEGHFGSSRDRRLRHMSVLLGQLRMRGKRRAQRGQREQ